MNRVSLVWLSRAVLLVGLAGAGAVQVLEGAAAACPAPSRDDASGTDLDHLPAGLSPDDQVAWVLAHTPVIHVTPVRE